MNVGTKLQSSPLIYNQFYNFNKQLKKAQSQADIVEKKRKKKIISRKTQQFLPMLCKSYKSKINLFTQPALQGRRAVSTCHNSGGMVVVVVEMLNGPIIAKQVNQSSSGIGGQNRGQTGSSKCTLLLCTQSQSEQRLD
jgi:hypothetical protein